MEVARKLTLEVDYESPLKTQSLNFSGIKSHMATVTLMIGWRNILNKKYVIDGCRERGKHKFIINRAVLISMSFLLITPNQGSWHEQSARGREQNAAGGWWIYERSDQRKW